MKKGVLWLVLVTVSVGMAIVIRAHDQKPAAGPAFVGDWRKAQPNDGLTVVKISSQGNRWVVHVWGGMHAS
jgi:hypothetical protein